MLLSGASIVMMASAMSGESDFAERRPPIEMTVFETDVGLTRIVRIEGVIKGASLDTDQ